MHPWGRTCSLVASQRPASLAICALHQCIDHGTPLGCSPVQFLACSDLLVTNQRQASLVIDLQCRRCKKGWCPSVAGNRGRLCSCRTSWQAVLNAVVGFAQVEEDEEEEEEEELVEEEAGEEADD